MAKKCEKKEAARRASMWWANKIANKGVDAGFVKDQMDGIGLNFMKNFKRNAQPTQIMRFQTELEERILKLMDERAFVELLVDYHPFAPLSDAAEAAGIDEMCFPMKTVCRIVPEGGDLYCVWVERLGGGNRRCLEENGAEADG